MITIGFLSEFMCTRALPDYESYMVLLLTSGLPALLPKKYAMKTYKVGEVGWARAIAMAARNNKQDVRYANLSGVSL